MENGMSVKFTPKSNEAQIQVCGEINQDTALLVHEYVREAAEHGNYEHLVLQINSPGGELRALRAIMHEMRWWRQRGGTLATETLMQAASAAALMLSLGDVGKRSAQPYTELLYHHSRFMAGQQYALTANNAEVAQQRLRQVDREFLHTLVKHIASAFGGIEALAQAGLARCQCLQANAASVAQGLGLAAGLGAANHRGAKKSTPLMLKRIENSYEKALKSRSPEPVATLLAEEFDRDAPMPVDVAWCLMLVDAVEMVDVLQPENTQQRKLTETLSERGSGAMRLAA
jgi:ATP-dependent protease ClpP protease subunit